MKTRRVGKSRSESGSRASWNWEGRELKALCEMQASNKQIN